MSTWLWYLSETKSAPQASNASPPGKFKLTDVARAPSTMLRAMEPPVPTAVVMIPEAMSTRRTRCTLTSQMKRLPEASNASVTGTFMVAIVAIPPSPVDEKLPHLPAYVVMMPPMMRLTTPAPESAT